MKPQLRCVELRDHVALARGHPRRTRRADIDDAAAELACLSWAYLIADAVEAVESAPVIVDSPGHRLRLGFVSLVVTHWPCSRQLPAPGMAHCRSRTPFSAILIAGHCRRLIEEGPRVPIVSRQI